MTWIGSDLIESVFTQWHLSVRVYFHGKVHCRDSCCQTVATLHRVAQPTWTGPVSARCASVCSRTLSPLEPDVPEIPRFWLSPHWDSHLGINENISEGEEARQHSMRRGSRVWTQLSPITDLLFSFFFKRGILLLIFVLLSLHLLRSQELIWCKATSKVWCGTFWAHTRCSGSVAHKRKKYKKQLQNNKTFDSGV